MTPSLTFLYSDTSDARQDRGRARTAVNARTTKLFGNLARAHKRRLLQTPVKVGIPAAQVEANMFFERMCKAELKSA